ncbi:MAG: N-acetyltransferase family protein [Elainellaceae cyanobacterium]
MPYVISTAKIEELDRVEHLINDYVRQSLNMTAWPCSIQTLKRDYTAEYFQMKVVYSDGQLVGFAAWTPSYDLHHCVRGAMFIDLYIDPAYRCRGLAVMLICAIAAEITPMGWSYMRGQALSGQASRLYDKVAVRFGANEYNISGQALRELATLAGKPIRDIVRGLPKKEMNYLP